MLEFAERTIKVRIDDSRCPQCQTKACIKGCTIYDRGILKLKDGKPTVSDLEEAKRAGTECLACEYECWFRGLSAIKIEIPTRGLEEYRTNTRSRMVK
jgi:hypothetical protein